MSSPHLSRTALAAVLLPFVACATTTFVSTWKAPDAQPVGPLKGKKVVAFVETKNAASRRAAEDALAREISRAGADGVPGYTLVDDSQVGDEAQARAAVEKAGAVGVVVMRPVAKDKAITATPGVYTGPMYGPYWGGYYGYGWGGAWAMGPDIRTDTIITVETLVYSLSQNKLIWAGQSKTTNPSNVDDFVRELAVGAANEMKKAGLL
jgi:hypothetical protein